MNIQWYPGHMTKARRMMQDNIKLVDLVIELVDARVPLSSRNPDIDDLGRNKARLLLLNKADLADEAANGLERLFPGERVSGGETGFQKQSREPTGQTIFGMVMACTGHTFIQVRQPVHFS